MLLTLPAKRGGGGEPQRRVRVLVRSEGPTRVLTVLDMQRHRCEVGWADAKHMWEVCVGEEGYEKGCATFVALPRLRLLPI